MPDKPSPSYYANIPAPVRYDKNLSANAKLLYGEITCLCNQRGYCWAQNRYFANLYGVSPKTVSSWISSLVKAGYIYLEMTYKDGTKEIDERRLYLKEAFPSNTYTQNRVGVYEHFSSYPHHENVMDNNINNNNTRYINNNAPFKNGDQKCTTSKEDGGRYSPFQEKEVHYSNNSNGRTDYTNLELHDYLVQNIYNNMQPDGYYQTTLDNETVFLPADFDRRGILLDIVEYFYAKYNSIHDMKHPILSYGAFARIIDNYLVPPKIMQDNEVYGFETYRQMIDVYFSIEFGKSGNSEYGTVKPINKYISHFMPNGIRENIYRRLIDKQI